MTNGNIPSPHRYRRRILTLLVSTWTILIFSSLALNLVQNERTTKDLALAEAKASYNKDIQYRKWASMHGGIYVPVTDVTRPSKYLSDIKERDITTESGRKLTLVNPAYMTRQVHEIWGNHYGLKGHITSLKPLKPENAPDDWEKKALLAFEKGEKETSGFERIDGELYIRYMKPIITEKSCLKCHESEGYRESTIAGGISVSVPYAQYEKTAADFRKMLVTSHILIMAFGLAGLWIAGRLLKKAEHSLVENEERYRTLFELSKYPVLTLNASSLRLISANRAAKELFGFSEDTVLSSVNPAELSPNFQPDGKLSSEKLAAMTDSASEKGCNSFEWLYKSLDGREFPATVHLTKIDIQGEPLIHATIQDITEQRKSEEALQIMNCRLMNISDNLPDGAIYQLEIDVNEACRFNYISAGITPIHGISPEEGMKDSSILYKSVHKDDIIKLDTAIKESIKNLSIFRMEARIIRTDGTVRWVLLNSAPRKTPEGKIIFDGIEIDITRLKTTEESLRESRERLNEAQRISHIGNWEIDIKTRNISWSDETYRIFEIPQNSCQHLYDSFSFRIHPDDREAFDTAYKTSIRKGVHSEIEHRLLMPDDRVKYIHASWEFLMGKDGNPEKSIGTVQDITHAKLQEMEKEKLKSQLLQVQKVESIGRLAGGVAHDFNNMLGVIIGHAELALDSLDEKSPINENLAEILAAAQRSADLTGQLLAFARKQTATPKILDLNEKIPGMLKMLRRLIGEDISLEWNPGKDLWLVNIDPSQIDQILANLLVNSRDAISGAGTVTISTRNKIIDEFFCRNHPDCIHGEYVAVSVTDDGAGMDSVVLEKIFEPFFTTKEMGRGTGLGLSTVYGIIRQNEGFVNVYSEIGKGTTFMIYLPRKSGEGKTEPFKEADIVPCGNGETILIVEDEPAILRLGKSMLNQLGYNVITSSSPSEAVRIAETHEKHIDLVITDIIMPETNGKELSSEITRIRPETKFLFMSGYPADIIANRGIIEDNICFIQKPFSMKELANGVIAAFAGQSQRI